MSAPEQPAAQAEEPPARPVWVRGLLSNMIGLGFLALIGWATDTWINALVSLIINWVVFVIHAFPFNSEKFFDSTGTLTYVTLILTAMPLAGLAIPGGVRPRQWVLSGMVLVWSIRLGSYLLMRICRDGKDQRFDEIKKNFLRWIGMWSVQALWCFLVTLPALVVISKKDKAAAGVTILDIIGWTIWAFGWIFEVIADRQKDAWRQVPENKGRFITVGLWSRSRHPNYFGEITLWIGVAISAMSDYKTPVDLLIWMSPFTTFMLLMFVSGVPLLETRADKEWGHEEEYKHYKANTPTVFPRLTAPPPYQEGGVPLAAA